MMEPMQTPMTRAEFERRFHLLKEQILQGKYLIQRGMTAGIEKIRLLPNGRIDFLSVNESARLQANMTLHMQNMPFMQIDQDNQDAKLENISDHEEEDAPANKD